MKVHGLTCSLVKLKFFLPINVSCSITVGSRLVNLKNQ